MRYAGTLSAAALVIGASGLALRSKRSKEKWQRRRSRGKISIRISGTSGADASTAPTPFKVQDPLLFNAVKPGDQVSVTTEYVNGVPTIKSLKKE